MNQERSTPKILGQALFSTGIAVLVPLSIGAVVLIISMFLSFFPNYKFYRSKNFYPSADVRRLETSKSLFEDDGIWLKFTASNETLDKLLGDDFYRVDRKSFTFYNQHLQEFLDNKNVVFYKNDPSLYKLRSGKVLLAFNPKRQKVFYLRRGLEN